MEVGDKIKCQILIEDIINRHLHGLVKITTPGEIIIQYAFIEIIGTATCEFPTEKTMYKFPRFYRKGTLVSNSEEFYFSRHTLCGGTIAYKHKGVASYEFCCGWPTRLPATWDAEFGRIKYMGKVTVIEEEGVFVHTQEVIVTAQRDLILEKHLLFESAVKVHKQFNFMKSLGTIDVAVWVPFSGIAVKQCIPVLCNVNNQSNFPFGSIIFVLTRIDIYRSATPLTVTKRVRTDICRVPKMVNIVNGQTDYFCILETDENVLPTNQFHKCTCCQIIYEIWISVQGAFPRYGPSGYPNIDTPGIPIVIGTEPLCKYNINKLTAAVMNTLLDSEQIEAEILPPDDEVEELLNNADEDMDEQTIENLNRQLEVESMAIKVELSDEKQA